MIPRGQESASAALAQARGFGGSEGVSTPLLRENRPFDGGIFPFADRKGAGSRQPPLADICRPPGLPGNRADDVDPEVPNHLRSPANHSYGAWYRASHERPNRSVGAAFTDRTAHAPGTIGDCRTGQWHNEDQGPGYPGTSPGFFDRIFSLSWSTRAGNRPSGPRAANATRPR